MDRDDKAREAKLAAGVANNRGFRNLECRFAKQFHPNPMKLEFSDRIHRLYFWLLVAAVVGFVVVPVPEGGGLMGMHFHFGWPPLACSRLAKCHGFLNQRKNWKPRGTGLASFYHYGFPGVFGAGFGIVGGHLKSFGN